VEQLLEREKLEEKQYISWAAHFAATEDQTPRPNAITSLLPLFNEKASSLWQ